MLRKRVIFGAAGTGKTTTLMTIIQDEFFPNYDKEQIAVLTFSRAGAQEIRQKFNLEKHEYPNIGRTLHSLFWEYYGRPKILDSKDLKIFCNRQKLPFEFEEQAVALPEMSFIGAGEQLGNKLITEFQKVRITHPYDYLRHMDSVESIDGGFLPVEMVLRLYDLYVAFKQEIGKQDHTDYLLQALNEKLVPHFACLVIDEFQDLSPLQYELYKLLAKNAQEIVVAGDDDQAIYAFMGCTPLFLLNERDGAEKIVLHFSRRCPKKIVEFGRRILDDVSGPREPKQMGSLSPIEGDIRVLRPFSLDGLLPYLELPGETLLMAATNRYCANISKWLTQNSIPHLVWGKKNIYSEQLFAEVVNALIDLANTGEMPRAIALKIAVETRGVVRRGQKSVLEEELKLLKSESVMRKPTVSRDEFVSWLRVQYTGLSTVSLVTLIAEHTPYLKDKPFFNFYNKRRKVQHPHIYVSTYHQSKGRGVDNVLLFTDLNRLIFDEIERSPDALDQLLRTFYVASTRVKNRLIIVEGLLNHRCVYSLSKYGRGLF